jgi:predicted dehydrogenase
LAEPEYEKRGHRNPHAPELVDRIQHDQRKRLLKVSARISQCAHFDAVRKARNAELYAICDRARDLAERMAAVHGPRKVYTDYDAMLADPDVEAVLVAVADQFHIPLCRKAIEAGKHVLVEKPLGVAVEECQDLGEFLRGKGLVFQVGNKRLTGDRLCAALRAGRAGEMIRKAWYCDRPCATS